MRWFFGFVAALVLVSCGGPTEVQIAPVAQNGQQTVPTPQPVPPGADGNYASNYALPAVTTVYTLTGTVLSAPGSLQQSSFSGSSSASMINGYGSASGYISGGTTGKGFVRFKVQHIGWFDPYVDSGVTTRSEAWTPLAKSGDIIMLKTIDSKASALGGGDIATFMCREQYEFVSAVAKDEIPTTASVTREFDECRMITPQFTPPIDQP